MEVCTGEKCVNERETGGHEGKVNPSKRRMVQAGWRRVSGDICDKRIAARVKEEVYKVTVRPAVMYGFETWDKRLSWRCLIVSLGVTRMSGLDTTLERQD